jgi:hypothetical protein
MPIKVLVKKISKPEIQEILDYYNHLKLPGEPALGYLSCSEGGFKLDLSMNDYIKHYKRYGGRNPPMKQIRWNNNLLVSYYNYPAFSAEEENRLYLAMIHVLGKEKIRFYKTFSDAIISSLSSRQVASLLSATVHITEFQNETPPSGLNRKSPVFIRRSPITRSPSTNSMLCNMQRSLSTSSLDKSVYNDITTHIWAVPRMRL